MTASDPVLLCAPDKLAGSVTAARAAAAIARGVRAAGGTAVELPIADGGPGTLEALALPVVTHVACRGPLGLEATGRLCALPGGALLVESADACGLHLDARRRPLRADTRGLGELLRAALDRAPAVVVGLGGTATADGGAGLAVALGATLLDRWGRRLPPHPEGLRRLARLELPDLRGWRGRVQVWCDVLAPLLPPARAAQEPAISGLSFLRQKGVHDEQAVRAAWQRWLEALADAGLPVEPQAPGAGAGGGLGLALASLLDAPLRGGADAVLDALDFEARLGGVDHVITAEGRFDRQSLAGKGPGRVVARAAAQGIPVTVLAGVVEEGLAPALPPKVRLIGISDRASPIAAQLAQGEARLEAAARTVARALAPTSSPPPAAAPE